MFEDFNNTRKLCKQKSINKLSPQEKFNKNWKNSDGCILIFVLSNGFFMKNNLIKLRVSNSVLWGNKSEENITH